MSSSTASELISVIAEAADSATEIFLVDASLKRQARGIGRLKAEVLPGLYKLRYVAGSAIVEQLVEVPAVLPGRTVTFNHDSLRFSAAAPLRRTLTTHEYQREPATSLSCGPSISIGRGSYLFLFIRDPDAGPDQSFEREPGKGVTVETLAGNPVAALDQSPANNPEWGYAAMRLEVDPGTYVLSVNTRVWGVQQMAITTCQGWQTQVFLCTRPFERRGDMAGDGRPRRACRADLFTASIAMARPEVGFEPDSQDARVSELGRQALDRGRNIMREGLLREALLAGKFRDPMLGLYAAHLLLLEEPWDRPLLEVVLSNLGRLGLGAHPDLAALRLVLGRRLGEDDAIFARPPSLRAGWRRIVDATAEAPGLVPAGSLAARIGTRVIGSSAWLIWRREGAAGQRRRDRLAKGGKWERPGIAEALEDLLEVLVRGEHEASERAVRGGDRTSSAPRIPYSRSTEALAMKAPSDAMRDHSEASGKRRPKLDALEQTVLEILKENLSQKRTIAEALKELTGTTGLPVATLAPIIEGIVWKKGGRKRR